MSHGSGNQSSPNETQSGPAIRTFQFDLNSIGNVSSSVNLFRGEVDLPLSMISLPGHNGLDVNVTAMYSGSVQQQVNTWNQTAPTSILGLGWSMPYEMILVAGKTTAAPEDGQFYLIENGAPVLLVRTSDEDGGPWSYATPHFRFWQIKRYFAAAQEYWEIVKEDGLTYQYGSTPDADGNQTAVQWGVYWESVNWLGAATAGTPSNYPLAWNLQQIRDSWGNAITFDYINEEVSLTSACSYTQASYLSSITDMFGRRVAFSYELKTPNEYAPAHPPAAGYQDRYETKYLDHFQLFSELGRELLTVRFGYDLADYSNNGLGTPGGICEKRYLRTITQENAGGSSLPGIKFDYLAPDPQHPGQQNNYGALERIHYPQGATATYSYETQPLPTSKLEAIVPPSVINRGQCGVWQGLGYVVLTDCGANGLSIVIETWNGAWVEPYRTSILGNFSPENLAVVTTANFCAVYSYESDTQNFQLNFFYMDPRVAGQWLTHSVSVPLAAPNGSGLELMLAAGNNFVVAGASSSSEFYFYQYVFQQSTNAATVTWNQRMSSPSAGKALALAATGNYAICASQGASDSQIIFTLSSTSDLGGWSNTSFGAPVSCVSGSPVFLSAGSSFANASYLVAMDPPGYDVRVFNWNSEFGGASSTRLNQATLPAPTTTTPYSIAPAISASSLVGSGPNLWRFDGAQWQSHTLTLANSVPAFSYGSDLALCTQDSTHQVSAAQFAPGDNWSPIFPQWSAGGPSVSSSFATIGNLVYTLNPSNDWVESDRLGVDELTSGSVQNLAPGYIASQSPNATNITLLRNGSVQQTQTIFGQSVYVPPGSPPPPPYPGQSGFAGPTAVATYAGTNIGNTNELTVYAVLNGAFQTVPAVYQVTRLTIDSGYTSTSTSFIYDNATAAFDPAGQIAQYANVLVYMDEDVSTPPTFESPTNCSVYTFHNSMPARSIPTIDADFELPPNYIPAAQCLQLVNGRLASIEIYDQQGQLVSSTINDWYGIYYMPTANVAPFPGLYVRQVQSQQMLDGVVHLKRYEYDPNTGLPSATIAYNVNSAGVPEVHTEESVYWYEKYDPELTLNLLKPVIQTTSTTEVGDETTITAISVTTWTDWNDPGNCPQTKAGNKWAPIQTYSRLTTPTDNTFPPAAWCDTSQPLGDDWLLTSRITQRAADSTPLEFIDVDGVYHSVVAGGFAGKCGFVTAVFRNANASECSYLGFEIYEQDHGWEFDHAQLTTEEAHTGDVCLRLAANADTPGLSRKWQLTSSGGNQTYTLSFWSRIASISEAAYWEISLPDRDPLHFAIDDTHSDWQYFSYVIDLGVLTAPSIEIELAAYNASIDAEVFIDDVRFSAFVCRSKAAVYDSDFGYQTARLGMNGDTMRAVYDSFQRCIAQVGPAENVTAIAAPYLSLQGSDPFSVSVPNSSLSIAAAGGGVYDDFALGQWQTLWDGDDAAWTVTNGLLTHTGAQTDELTFKDSGDYANYGVRLHVVPLGAVLTPASLAFGAGVLLSCIEWGAQQIWELSVGGVLKTRVALPSQTGGVAPAAQDWLSFCIDDALLFYVDGRQVFAESLGTPIAGSLRLFATGSIGYENAIVFLSPNAAVSYLDGAGRTVQQQQLEWGNATAGVNCIAAQSFADPADPSGRIAVKTKPARYPATLFGYQPDLASDESVWTNGPLTGYVASQYPADAGYPFTRVAFEQSPLARPVEKGVAGLPYAITDSVPPHTVRKVYAGGASSFYPEPVDAKPPFNYAIEEQIDQNGNVTFKVSDMLDRVTAAGAVIASGGAATYQQTLYEYDAAGNVVTVVPPNANAQTNTQWNTTMQYDFLRRLVQLKTPDTGTSSYVYDRAGRLRFLQDANGAAAGYYLYKKYDALGRPIEEGMVEGAWDRTALQNIAYNEPAQPEPPDFAPIWRKRFAYDGDGSDPAAHLAGRVWKLFANNGNTSADVTEEFGYNLAGDTTTDTLTVADYGDDAYKISYDYDNLRRIVRITYDPATPTEVVYRFNGLGQLIAIGDPHVADDSYAAYTYDADGLVTTTVLNGSGPQVFTFANTYNSPGWLLSSSSANIDDGVGIAESLTYDGYFNGNISVAERTCSAEADFEYQYTYDTLNQLTQATNTNESDSVGPVAYDLNDNITNTTAGGIAQTYAYGPASNALQNVSAGGKTLTSYTYDPNGNVLTSAQPDGGGLSLTYDTVTGLTTAIAVAGPTPQAVQLSYGARNERVLKSVGDSRKLYVHGPAMSPLVERVRTNGVEQTPTIYIYGPSGLLAFKSDRLYFVISDHEGSTRFVLDNNGQIVAGYDYLPFGATAQTYGPQPAILNYLYTGQELDPETGLYNYRARMYDAALARFLQPDPARQYASPYVYGGDDPVMNVDLTGLMSGGEIALVSTFIALAIAGVALTIATAGTDTPVLAALAGATIGGAATGAGVSSTVYFGTHVHDFDIKQWGQQVGIGAAGGAVSGFVAGGLNIGVQFAAGEAAAEAAEAFGAAAAGTSGTAGRAAVTGLVPSLFANIGIGIVAGISGGLTSQLVSNRVNGVALDTDLGYSFALGALTGMAEGVISVGAEAAISRVSRVFAPTLVRSFAETETVSGRSLAGVAVLHQLLAQPLNYAISKNQQNPGPWGLFGG